MAQMLTVGKYRSPYQTSGYGSYAGAAGGQFMPASYAQGPPISGGTGIRMPKLPGGGYYTGDAGTTDTTDTTDLSGVVSPAPGVVIPAVPAYNPDYASMIGGSYEVAQAEALMGQQMGAARASFQKNLRQAFIDLGYQGDMNQNGLGDFSKYIDKDTMQKAIDNKFSQYAQIQKQQQTAAGTNASALAARGLLSSGLNTTMTSNLESQVEQARYDSLRNFLQGGEQGLENLSNLKFQLAQGVMQ